MSLDNKKNEENKDVDGYDEDAEHYDPKAEYQQESNIKEEMEGNDTLAIILAGFKVFAPFIIIAIILIFLLTR